MTILYTKIIIADKDEFFLSEIWYKGIQLWFQLGGGSYIQCDVVVTVLDEDFGESYQVLTLLWKPAGWFGTSYTFSAGPTTLGCFVDELEEKRMAETALGSHCGEGQDINKLKNVSK